MIQVGWTPFVEGTTQPRRLLMYVSDADFHIAGDGARAGIYTPNPQACYFDDNADNIETTNVEGRVNRMSTMVSWCCSVRC